MAFDRDALRRLLLGELSQGSPTLAGGSDYQIPDLEDETPADGGDFGPYYPRTSSAEPPGADMGVGPYGPAAPRRNKLSFLTRLGLVLQPLDTPLSHRRGDARTQIFLRSLLGAANRAAQLTATKQMADESGAGMLSTYNSGAGTLSAGQRSTGYGGHARGKGGEFDWRREMATDKFVADQDYRNRSLDALIGERKTDNERADKTLAANEANREFLHGIANANLGLRRESVSLSRQRFAFAKQRAAALISAITDPMLKTEVATKAAALGRLYDEDEEGSDVRYWQEIQGLIQDARQRSTVLPNDPYGQSPPAMLKRNMGGIRAGAAPAGPAPAVAPQAGGGGGGPLPGESYANWQLRLKREREGKR